MPIIAVLDDLKSRRAPVLLSVLTAAGTGSTGSSTCPLLLSIIGMVVVLLQARSKNMGKLQLIPIALRLAYK